MVWKCFIYIIVFIFLFPVSSSAVPTSLTDENENLTISTSVPPPVKDISENLSSSTPVYTNVSTQSDEVGDDTCDDGWFHFRQKCYRVEGWNYENKRPWQTAASICETYGGHLVSINSKAELDFLVNSTIIPLKGDAWIGMHDRDTEATYSWQDGSPINYTHFMIGEPNHRFQSEDCIRMVYENRDDSHRDVIGEWRDTECSDSHAYICQKKIVDNNENSWTTQSGKKFLLPCDVGWLHFKQKCYKLGGLGSHRNEDTASSNCRNYGGNLVSINSKEELDFLVNNIMLPFKSAVWIGLRQEWGQYSWQDGTPANFTNWARGQPNQKVQNEDCIIMLYNLQDVEDNVIGKWKTHKCSNSRQYICEKKRVSSDKDESENLPNSTPVPTDEVLESDDAGNMTCEVGWHHFEEKCYKHIGTTYDALQTWKGAADNCVKYGGHLVSINSQKELDFLVNNALMHLKRNVWIGLNDRDLESIFAWQDGSPINYTNYMIGEPNNADQKEDCTLMLYKSAKRENVLGQWKDVKCSLYNSYICQKKIVSPSSTNETENIPNSVSGNLSLEAGIAVTSVILVFVLLGAGIYKFQPDCIVKYFRRNIPPPVPTTSRPNLSIFTEEEEENYYEPMDYENIQYQTKLNDQEGPHTCKQMGFFQHWDNRGFESSIDEAKTLSQIPRPSSIDNQYITQEDIAHYEPMNCKVIDNQRFEPIHQNPKSLPQITVHPSTNDILKQNSKKELFEQEGDSSYVQMGASIKAKSISKILTHSPKEYLPMHSTKEDCNPYETMGCSAQENKKRFENIYENSRPLSRISVHSFPNNGLQQSSKKEFFEQEEISYEPMDFFKSSSDKEKSLSQIPTHSSIDNFPLPITNEYDNPYERMGCYEPQNNEKQQENAKSLPQIAVTSATNSIPNHNSRSELFEQDEEDSYEHMGFNLKAKSISQIPTHLSNEDYNPSDPMSCSALENKKRFETVYENARLLPRIPAHSSTNNIRNQNLGKELFEQNEENSYEHMGFNLKAKSISQIPTHLSNEDYNPYDPMSCSALETKKCFEKVYENARPLPQIPAHSSANSIPKQNSGKEVFGQDEDISYECMGFNLKAKSISQIPIHSSKEYLSKHDTKEDYNPYESMNCFAPENKKRFKNAYENSRPLPQIPVHPFTNDIPTNNSTTEFFEQEEHNSYEQMGFFNSRSDSTKSEPQIPSNSSKDNRPVHRTEVDNNYHEQIGYLEVRNNQDNEKKAKKAKSEILTETPLNTLPNERLQTHLPIQEDHSIYETMC